MGVSVIPPGPLNYSWANAYCHTTHTESTWLLCVVHLQSLGSWEHVFRRFKIMEFCIMCSWFWQATDADSLTFREITYRMVSTNTDFTIDPVSGVIATGRVFDWETEPIRQFVFQVTTEEGVNDVGVPASRATVTIDLYVSHKDCVTLTHCYCFTKLHL